MGFRGFRLLGTFEGVLRWILGFLHDPRYANPWEIWGNSTLRSCSALCVGLGSIPNLMEKFLEMRRMRSLSPLSDHFLKLLPLRQWDSCAQDHRKNHFVVAGFACTSPIFETRLNQSPQEYFCMQGLLLTDPQTLNKNPMPQASHTCNGMQPAETSVPPCPRIDSQGVVTYYIRVIIGIMEKKMETTI